MCLRKFQKPTDIYIEKYEEIYDVIFIYKSILIN
jgi:hypothetical protein